jgi:hypothetical protein
MALFYCIWDDEHSFLVDVADEATAKAAAIEEVGKPPSLIRAIPLGVFGVRVVFEDDAADPEAEIVTIEGLPHVLDLLGELEDEAAAPEEESVPTVVPMCTSEALDAADNVVHCELAAGHFPAEPHKAGNLTWREE